MAITFDTLKAHLQALLHRFRKNKQTRSTDLINKDVPIGSAAPKLPDQSNFQGIYHSYYQRTGNSLTSTITNKGSLGELQTFSELGRRFGFENTFANVYLPSKEGHTSEIDIILFTYQDIYIVENKNFAGSVYGKEADTEWTQYIRGKSFKFLNPILQNQGHCKAFLRTFPDTPKSNIIPIVVFNNICTVKVATTSPVLHRGDLVSFIEDRQKNGTIRFNESEIAAYKEVLLKFSLQSNQVKQNHINYVQQRRESSKSRPQSH